MSTNISVSTLSSPCGSSKSRGHAPVHVLKRVALRDLLLIIGVLTNRDHLPCPHRRGNSPSAESSSPAPSAAPRHRYRHTSPRRPTRPYFRVTALRLRAMRACFTRSDGTHSARGRSTSLPRVCRRCRCRIATAQALAATKLTQCLFPAFPHLHLGQEGCRKYTSECDFGPYNEPEPIPFNVANTTRTSPPPSAPLRLTPSRRTVQASGLRIQLQHYAHTQHATDKATLYIQTTQTQIMGEAGPEIGLEVTYDSTGNTLTPSQQQHTLRDKIV